jgi:Na+/alanine symporter
MLHTLETLTGEFVGIVWGLPLVFALSFSGLLFTVYFGFPQLRFFKHAHDMSRGNLMTGKTRGRFLFSRPCVLLFRQR